jgi:hypothetical protein
MLRYDELIELARLCAHNARIATSLAGRSPTNSGGWRRNIRPKPLSLTAARCPRLPTTSLDRGLSAKLVAKGDRPQIAYTSVAIRRTLAATIGTDTPRQYAAVTASDLSILGNSLTLSGLATSLTLANQITDSGFAYRGLGTRGATRPRLNVGR